jgi:hypothetical protein
MRNDETTIDVDQASQGTTAEAGQATANEVAPDEVAMREGRRTTLKLIGTAAIWATPMVTVAESASALSAGTIAVVGSQDEYDEDNEDNESNESDEGDENDEDGEGLDENDEDNEGNETVADDADEGHKCTEGNQNN